MLEVYICSLPGIAFPFGLTLSFSNLHFLGLAFVYSRDVFGIRRLWGQTIKNQPQISHVLHISHLLETLHESKIHLKSITIFLDDNGALLIRPKQAFRSIQNVFKKLLRNLKNKDYLTEFSTD